MANLAPGYFALVMATGILSTGLALQGHDLLSQLFLWVCAGALVVLCVLNSWRFLAFRAQVVADFTDPRRGFGFLTFVAGVNVLGVRLGMDGHDVATGTLLAIAAVAWLVLGYLIPWTAVLARPTRPVLAGANGTWFISTVAAQSVAVAAATVEPLFTTGRSALALLAVLSWSVGVMLYALVGILVVLRLLLHEFGPQDIDPSYWITMGALAITVLAGSRIISMADAPMAVNARGIVGGLSVLCWNAATWLFPVLVAVGVWRHAVRRVPLRYEPLLWSMVFPLGMYAVCGLFLDRADNLPLVRQISAAELWLAVAAGTLVFVAMLHHWFRDILRAPAPAS